MLPAGNLLRLSRHRPGRLIKERTNGDLQANSSFGDPVIFKAPGTARFLFQNVKGLTHSTSNADYKYYMQGMSSYAADVFGMAETNTCWQHPHLQLELKENIRKQFRIGKTVFGYPSEEVDPSPPKATFQSGGTVQVVQGRLATTAQRNTISDPSGMGRWCGMTYEGKEGRKLSVITGYRVCSGSVNDQTLGSAYHREHAFLRQQGDLTPNPRKNFIDDISAIIRSLQDQDHAILLMLDANSTLASDRRFRDFVTSRDLIDLHSDKPAPSTYIASPDRRIDYMLGCPRTHEAMTRQGSLSYFEGLHSDHRGLYVDLDLAKLFGSDLPDDKIGSSELRSLRSGNPEHVITYNSAMHKYYEHHHMHERITHLHANHITMTRKEVRKLLESWDSDQGRAMKTAEAVLKVPPKQYQWFPKLRNAGVVYRYWRLRLRELTHDEDYSSTFILWTDDLREHDKSFKLPEHGIPLDQATVRKHLNASQKALRKLQSSSTDLRIKSYHDLVAAYDADTNHRTIPESRRKAKIANRTIQSEARKRLFGLLRQVVKPSEFSALAKLQIPRSSAATGITPPDNVHQVLKHTSPDNLIWDTIIDKQDIESHLLQYNREAFRAAAESPCGHGLIHDALTFTSLSPDAAALLQGELPAEWSGDNDLLREFLASFQIPDTILSADPIPTDISEADITRGFKAWRESTSTSPSGRHLGHYKALIQDPTLLDCLCKFLNIAISRGISVSRWSNAVNVMIEKDPGQPKINRLRIIHLFEADYNLFLKIMWGSRLVRRAVLFDVLHDGQHGSVPGRNPMDPIMLHQLTTDLCRLLKLNFARFDNDASACYDRIIVALAMLAARRCGMPNSAIRTHAQALRFMQYTVKTVYGVSEASYKGTPLEPLFGTGQGSGASPAVWLSLVVILLNTLERVVPERISFRSPDGTLDHRRLVDAFVDDTALGLTDDGSLSFSELVTSLERIAQTWEQILHFSGGALNLKKCSWYIMYWDWVNGRPVLRPITEEDPTVNLRQGSILECTTPIPRQPLTSAARVLGVHQTPMGDFSAHIQILKSKADTFSGYLKSPRLKPSDVRVFHKTIYGPSMRYSLAAIAADEEELEQIQTKIIPSIVQRLGFSSKLPTAIRHGPREMGGLGLLDLRTEGGLEMIKYFRHAVYSDSQVGRLLLLQLQTSQLESGLPNPLLEEPTLSIPYLTPTWILSMRQFLSNHNITITLTGVEDTPLRYPTDQHIMNLDHLTHLQPGEKIDLNLVRMYLQVKTLSDLSDPSDRAKIPTWALTATRPSGFSSLPHWPRQATPSPTQRRIWRKYIKSHFIRNDRYWIVPPIPRRQTAAAPSDPPNHAQATSDLPSLIKQLPRNHRRLLSHVRQVATDQTLQQISSQTPSLTISSDGGLKGYQGTFGWQLSSATNEILYEGAGPVDGPLDSASSTRCELGGLVAPLLLMALVCNKFGALPTAGLRWVTDSKCAISNVQSMQPSPGYAKRQPNNVDYLASIHALSTSFDCPLEPVWIKGHQDSSTLPEGATRQDIDRNNKVDELATWYRDQPKLPQSKEATEHAPESRVSISVNGLRLVGHIEPTLRHHIDGCYLRCYMQSKHNWNDRTWNSVDLESFGKFYLRLPQNEQDYSTKAIYNQLYVGTNRFKTAKIQDPALKLCPCCKQATEDRAHLFRCPDNPDRPETLRLLRKSLSPTDPHPAYYVIKEGILRWLEGDDNPFTPATTDYPEKFHDSLRKAIDDQNSIGWQHALHGYLSVEWRHILGMAMYDEVNPQEGRGPHHIRIILKALHTATRTLWLSRNGALHGDQTVELDRIRSVETAEITAYYQQQDQLLAGDRHYCTQPLANLLRKNPSTRRRWLRYIRMARHRFVEHSKGQTRITSFFRHLNG